jgi:hypothetical protein
MRTFLALPSGRNVRAVSGAPKLFAGLPTQQTGCPLSRLIGRSVPSSAFNCAPKGDFDEQ